jgi:hypothetical protein
MNGFLFSIKLYSWKSKIISFSLFINILEVVSSGLFSKGKSSFKLLYLELSILKRPYRQMLHSI